MMVMEAQTKLMSSVLPLQSAQISITQTLLSPYHKFNTLQFTAVHLAKLVGSLESAKSHNFFHE